MNHAPIIAVAPMMRYTDCHFLYLCRLLSKHVRLYTEMLTAQAVVYGNVIQSWRIIETLGSCAVQLGGSDPKHLTIAAQKVAALGCNEINLNIGCPSDRVRQGQFGACLMAEPERVADCIAHMKQWVTVPITVKTRIGIDHQDSEEFLHHFIKTVSDAGCNMFIIHARKAWLKGLNPKQNRQVPPLRYEVVYHLKRTFPHLQLVLNGGLVNLDVEGHLAYVDGVMYGRQAYKDPWMLNLVDSIFFNEPSKGQTRQTVMQQYLDYVTKHTEGSLFYLLRPLMQLFHGQPHATFMRRTLQECVLAKESISTSIGKLQSLLELA